MFQCSKKDLLNYALSKNIDQHGLQQLRNYINALHRPLDFTNPMSSSPYTLIAYDNQLPLRLNAPIRLNASERHRAQLVRNLHSCLGYPIDSTLTDGLNNGVDPLVSNNVFTFLLSLDAEHIIKGINLYACKSQGRIITIATRERNVMFHCDIDCLIALQPL